MSAMVVVLRVKECVSEKSGRKRMSEREVLVACLLCLFFDGEEEMENEQRQQPTAQIKTNKKRRVTKRPNRSVDRALARTKQAIQTKQKQQTAVQHWMLSPSPRSAVFVSY